MNALLKTLFVAVIGCSMAQISAMQGKKPAAKKPGQSGNIGAFLKAKYCPQPAAQDTAVDKPGKEEKVVVDKK